MSQDESTRGLREALERAAERATVVEGPGGDCGRGGDDGAGRAGRDGRGDGRGRDGGGRGDDCGRGGGEYGRAWLEGRLFEEEGFLYGMRTWVRRGRVVVAALWLGLVLLAASQVATGSADAPGGGWATVVLIAACGVPIVAYLGCAPAGYIAHMRKVSRARVVVVGGGCLVPLLEELMALLFSLVTGPFSYALQCRRVRRLRRGLGR